MLKNQCKKTLRKTFRKPIPAKNATLYSASASHSHWKCTLRTTTKKNLSVMSVTSEPTQSRLFKITRRTFMGQSMEKCQWQKLEMNCKSKLINYLILVEEKEGIGKDQRHFGHQNWRIQDNWKTVEQGRKDTMPRLWRHIRQTWFIEEAQREEALHKR